MRELVAELFFFTILYVILVISVAFGPDHVWDSHEVNHENSTGDRRF